ncbi:hypothetical protein SEA_CALAMITOUS_40 [Mycobacterium phage Calamitous]|nr:hypothetical protein SEA_CALAMITOUS_40 [Mycobacterium phage Calamitous]
MYDPPPGYDDLMHDCGGDDPPVDPVYRELEVPGIGTVRARPPMPNAVGALAMAARSGIDPVRQVDYLGLFVRNHLAPGEVERLLVGQMEGQYPTDTIQQVAKAVSVWGTARPTRRSSR